MLNNRYINLLHRASLILVEWFREHGAKFPWRGEIGWYGILVAETMLIRTRRNVAERVFVEFMEKYPTPESLCRADIRDVEVFFKKIGLPARAVRLKETICRIVAEYHGSPPCNYTELVELPGVGSYIARVLLARVCRLHYAFVDTNVNRVVSRLLGVKLDARTVEKLLETSIEPGRLVEVNTALLDIGDKHCKPRNPNCVRCPLRTLCEHGKRVMEGKGNIVLP